METSLLPPEKEKALHKDCGAEKKLGWKTLKKKIGVAMRRYHVCHIKSPWRHTWTAADWRASSALRLIGSGRAKKILFGKKHYGSFSETKSSMSGDQLGYRSRQPTGGSTRGKQRPAQDFLPIQEIFKVSKG